MKTAGEIDVMLLASGFLLVGAHSRNPCPGSPDIGSIHIFNLAANSEQVLVVHDVSASRQHLVPGWDSFLWKYDTGGWESRSTLVGKVKRHCHAMELVGRQQTGTT